MRILACLAAMLAMAMASPAQVHLDTGAREMLASSDSGFAMSAVQHGLGAVDLGKLAAEKASNPALRQFGAQAATEHARWNERLQSLVSQEKMVLPQVMTADDQRLHDKLSRLSGAAFDKLYIRERTKSQKNVLKAFERQAKHGKDERLRSFASDALPALQQQLDQLRSLSRQTS